MMEKMKSKIRSFRYLILLFLFLLVLVDILILNSASDIKFFGVLTALIVLYLLTRFKSVLIFSFCIVLLFLLSAFYLIEGPMVRSEKIAVWFVLLLGFGLFQKWRE